MLCHVQGELYQLLQVLVSNNCLYHDDDDDAKFPFSRFYCLLHNR